MELTHTKTLYRNLVKQKGNELGKIFEVKAIFKEDVLGRVL